MTNADFEIRALPILRRLGTQCGSISMLRTGDFSMIKVWAGLEARQLITASVEEVSFATHQRAPMFALTRFAQGRAVCEVRSAIA